MPALPRRREHARLVPLLRVDEQSCTTTRAETGRRCFSSWVQRAGGVFDGFGELLADGPGKTMMVVLGGECRLRGSRGLNVARGDVLRDVLGVAREAVDHRR